MSTVALYVHGGRREAVEVGGLVARWLLERGHEVVTSDQESRLILEAGGPDLRPDHPSRELELVMAVGGDGTMLRATRRAVEGDAAVLGVNLGQLGYLTEVEPGGWEAALEGWLAGRHTITERLLVAPSITAGELEGVPAPDLPPALNEVVIEKQTMGRTVRLGVAIDGEFFTSYVADGLILATPTGSTAYSLSARGPIIDPTHRALLLTPVSPHSLFDRSLVLEPSSTVEVSVLGDRPAALSIDGEHAGVLPPGTVVAVTAAQRPARFVTFGGRDFHQILKAKFGLSDR